MWKNYLKTSLRNIFRNKTTAAIQIGGLAAGLATSMLIMFYVHFERSYENMYDKADRIYRLALELYNGNELLEVDTETYQTLGPEFKSIMPEVLDYVRFYHIGTSEITAGNFTGQELSLHQFGKLQMGVFLLGVIAFGTLISGFYPAMILSRFKPALILKGRFSNSGKGIMLRKTLVFAQFTASAILICMSVAVYCKK